MLHRVARRVGPSRVAATSQPSDEAVVESLPHLRVFGRVTSEDKVRLARSMQESGDVVAMTGDAVNDAAALEQADVGVAMGSGSEVSKQAAKMVLTDDNLATPTCSFVAIRSWCRRCGGTRSRC
jgi:Ca2+-transporting ATPase